MKKRITILIFVVLIINIYNININTIKKFAIDSNTPKLIKNELKKNFNYVKNSIDDKNSVTANKYIDDNKTLDYFKKLDYEKKETIIKLFKDYPDYIIEIKHNDKKIDNFVNLKEDTPIYKADKLNRSIEAITLLNKNSILRNYKNQQKFDKNPVGWAKNKKVKINWLNGKIYNGYFWNRSHLIADSLGGSVDIKNLIPGTRTQNIGGNHKGGMRKPEILAYNYIKSNNKTLLYIVKPYYKNNNLIPYLVTVHLKNDEIDKLYVVFNIANGYIINYSNGNFFKYD